MLYDIYHKIEFFDFDKVTNISKVKAELATFNSLLIDSDIENLTDTASITIPYSNFIISGKELLIKGSEGTTSALKVGDKVEITLDYYRNEDELKLLKSSITLKPIFVGFIAKFDANDEVIEIMCEDYMYLFKQSKVNFSFNLNTNLEVVIDALIGDAGLSRVFDIAKDSTDLLDIDLGTLRTESFVTPAKVLQTIKDKYGVYTYFKLDSDSDPVLYTGLKYKLDLVSLTEIPKLFQYPYDSKAYAIIVNQLNYESFDKSKDLGVLGSINTIIGSINTKTNKDTRKNVKATFGTGDGTNIAIAGVTPLKGDSFEEISGREFIINLNIPSIDDEAIKILIRDTWNNHSATGFQGSFTTFGTPSLKIGSIIELNVASGARLPNTGNYYIDSVVTKINSNNGFIQEVTIGSEIS